MSKYQLVLSPRVKADLEEIYTYTHHTWGKEQAHFYLEKIEQAMNELLRHPKKGKARLDIKMGYRSLSVEKHVIFYAVKDYEIQIYRILHERMDIISRLSNP